MPEPGLHDLDVGAIGDQQAGEEVSRCLEAPEPLVPAPVEAINVSSAYLFRKVSDSQPTILYDEIETVSGPRAKANEEIRGLLNAGHRRGAVAGRCVVKGRRIETEEIPAYCAVALAGLTSATSSVTRRSCPPRPSSASCAR